MNNEDDPSLFDVGDIVWVKLGVQWWPGEICAEDKVPHDVLSSHKKSPIAIVKFFHEDTYEFVKNQNQILPYNNPKKMDLIRKGMEIVRQNNNKHMSKFPSDIKTAEEIIDGDVDILDKIEYTPTKKLNYSVIFGDQTKKTNNKKGSKGGNQNNNQTHRGRGRRRRNSLNHQNANQKMTTPPSRSKLSLDKNHESRMMPQTTLQTSPNASPGTYKCHLCDFTSTRQNVIVLHSKTHSSSSTPLISNKPKEPKSILKKTTKPIESILIEDSDSNFSNAEIEQQQQRRRDHDDEENDGGGGGGRSSKNQNKSKTIKRKSPAIPVKPSRTKTPNRRGRPSTPFKMSVQQNSFSSDEDELERALPTSNNSISRPIPSSHTLSSPALKDKKKIEKQNEIRSKLLADWSDDDDNNDKINKKRKSSDMSNEDTIRAPTRLEIAISPDLIASAQDNDELCELIKQSNLSSSSSSSTFNLDATAASTCTKQQHQQITNAYSSAETATSTSAQPKYRNIPKKDRRDIVLKDFADNSSRISSETLITQNSENSITSEEKSQNSNEGDEFPPSKHDKAKKLLKSSSIDRSNSSSEEMVVETITKTTVDKETTESSEISEKVIEQINHAKEEVETEKKEKGNEAFNEKPDIELENSKDQELVQQQQQQHFESSPKSKNSDRFSVEKHEEITSPSGKGKSVSVDERGNTAAINNSGVLLNKSSISCFDFKEDEDDNEDFLASISKLKKKYLSPDKNRTGEIVTTTTDDNDDEDESVKNEKHQKMKEQLELEQKDKQLSDDIERLLNATKLPEVIVVDDNSKSSKTIERSISSSSLVTNLQGDNGGDSSHQEVRTLPPKERGKRIFKSRNRSRYEESTSTSIVGGQLAFSINNSLISTSNLSTSLQQEQKIQQSDEIDVNKQQIESIDSTNTIVIDDETNSNQEMKGEDSNEKNEGEVTTTLIEESKLNDVEESNQEQQNNEIYNVIEENNTLVTVVTETREDSEIEKLDSNNLNEEELVNSKKNEEILETLVSSQPQEDEKRESPQENEVMLPTSTAEDQEEVIQAQYDDISDKNIIKPIESEEIITTTTLISSLSQNNRELLDDPNYRNELAVAETLISIPSKLNDEMESKKSAATAIAEQNLLLQQTQNEEKIEDEQEVNKVELPIEKHLLVSSTNQVEISNTIVPPAQRKRRAHMKITPRKRIIQESSSSTGVTQQVAVIPQIVEEIPINYTNSYSQERLQSPKLSVPLEVKQQMRTESPIKSEEIIENDAEKKNTIQLSVRSDDASQYVDEKQSTTAEDVNFVEKYIKDAMMFASTDDGALIEQQQQQEPIETNILENHDKLKEEVNSVETEKVEKEKLTVNEENNTGNVTEEKVEKIENEKVNEPCNENKMKLTSKQITEILDLRSIGMRADTPKSEIDTIATSIKSQIISASSITTAVAAAEKEPAITVGQTQQKEIDNESQIENKSQILSSEVSVRDNKVSSNSKNLLPTEQHQETSVKREVTTTMLATASTLETTEAPTSVASELKKDDFVMKNSKRRKSEMANLSQSSSTSVKDEIIKVNNEVVEPTAERSSSLESKSQLYQFSSTKEFVPVPVSGGSIISSTSTRSSRPRKAKENIDARIRASLSPPHLSSSSSSSAIDNSVTATAPLQHHQKLPTHQSSLSQSSPNNNSGLYMEMIQAQKSTSLKTVIKNSKIDANKHRLSQNNEKISTEQESILHQEQEKEIITPASVSSISRLSSDSGKSVEQHQGNVSTVVIGSVSNKLSSKSPEKHTKPRQKSISEQQPQQQKTPPVRVEQSTTSSLNINKAGIANSTIISSTASNVEIRVKPSTKPYQQQQRKQSPIMTTDIVQKPKLIPVLEHQQKHQTLQTVILDPKSMSPTTTLGGNRGNIGISSSNKQQLITVESKPAIETTTVRVPKKRKPAFDDDIEEQAIPSFVINKKLVLSVSSPSSSPNTIGQEQQHQLKKPEKMIINTKEIEIQQPKLQPQKQKQQQQKIICKNIDDSQMFDINNIPILLSNDTTMLQSSGGGGHHIIITPHSSSHQTVSAAAAVAGSSLTSAPTAVTTLITQQPMTTMIEVINENVKSTVVSTPLGSPLTRTLQTVSTANKTTTTGITKKKILKPQQQQHQQSQHKLNLAATTIVPATNNQTVYESVTIPGSGITLHQHHHKATTTTLPTTTTITTKTKQQQTAVNKVVIQDEPKQIGIDGKGNKFVIIRSENGAKMIIQPDTPSVKPTATKQRKEILAKTITTTTTTTTTSIHSSTSSTGGITRKISQQQQQQQQQHQQTLLSGSVTKTSSDKANVISSQIISPTTGKHILSKTVGSPTISIGTDSNLVITSKGNVYSSSTGKPITATSKTSSIQSSVAVTQIINMSSSPSISSVTPSASSVSASSLTRRLSRQGTTLQAVTGDRVTSRPIEEPPKVIIQQKTIVDEVCSSSGSQILLQKQQQQQQQLEPGEISASEAAELTSRFGFIEVQQIQSPSPPPPPPIKHVVHQQPHKIIRKARNKSEEVLSKMNKFNTTEIPPLVALNDNSTTQQQQQKQQQQQTPRTSVKRKHISSSSSISQPHVVQQGVQTLNKPVMKQMQNIQTPVQQVQFSPSPLPSPEKVIIGGNTVVSNTPSPSSASGSSNLSKKINDNQKLLAVPGESFGGPPGSFYLCTTEKEGYVPVDNVPLFLDANNQLLPLSEQSSDPHKSGGSAATTATIIDDGTISLQDAQVIVETGDEDIGEEHILTDLSQLGDGTNQFILNTDDGQQIILDQQSLLALAANSAAANGSDPPQFITVDGQQLILASDVLSAVNQSGDLGGPILLSETIDGQLTATNSDILAAALAGTAEVYQDPNNPHQLLQIDNGGNVLQIETSNGVQIVEQSGITFQPIQQAPVTAQTSETNAILTQPPIMSTLEVPSTSCKKKPKLDPQVIVNTSKSSIGQNIDDSLAVIGVTTQSSTVPSSLNLPITVTNPAIAPKSTANPIALSSIYPTTSGTSNRSQISPTLTIGGSGGTGTGGGNEQELVSAGYELFTTSAIDSSSHDQSGGADSSSGNLVIDCGDGKGDIIVTSSTSSSDEQHQHQLSSSTNEEIVMTDFVSESVHHHHPNEFIVQQQQHQQNYRQVSSGNYDNSTNNR